ncbi:leucine-rich repeat transmembrane protein kinase protein [Tanacetum coccineum]
MLSYTLPCLLADKLQPNHHLQLVCIDCGVQQIYTDDSTHINYVSDDGFIDGGERHEVLSNYRVNITTNAGLQLTTLRSFPEHEQNCYTLKPPQGKNNRYLIRARFAYGNYDLKNQNPRFDVYLGADYWFTVVIMEPSATYSTEIIHFTSSDYINVCLRNTGHGIPFISVLELRLLDITMYKLPTPILHYFRYSSSNRKIRYENDRYDRIWCSLSIPDSVVVQSSNVISSGPLDDEKLSFEVMRNAVTPENSTNSLTVTWHSDDDDELLIYIHLAEVEILESNQKREFNIYLNGNDLFGSFSPSTNITTLTSQTSTGLLHNTLKIIKTTSSTLPPILNAIEIYIVMQFQQYQTDDQDAAAIWNIKSAYKLKRNWQGDPCVPRKFLWEGLNCDYNDLNASKIIFLNLSSSGLSGEIVTALANLTLIESLDLSYNNLTGAVPQFLASLNNLKLVNLTGNNFTRPLPAELLAKSKKGALFLSIEVIGDQDKGYCLNGSCENKKHTKVVIPVIVAIVVVIVLLIAFFIVWKYKWRKTKDSTIKDATFQPRNKQYTYSEVQSFTDNFTTVIGKGGFGTVFRGSIRGNQVAVKMLSESSSQGYKEFQAEAMAINIQANIISCHVYYVEGLGHNLVSVRQFCDGELEVAFHSNTCYVQNLEGDDLLTGGRDSNLYTISISNMAASSPVCLMSKETSTKSWLWHRRLSHLNVGTINNLTGLDLVDGLLKFKYGKNHLCSSCKRGKTKKASHPPKLVPSDHSKLSILHMDLCDTKRLNLNYKAKVCKIRTDNGTEFKNATLKAHYEKLGIMQQFSTACTPQQNGVVERRNHTLVEAARTMLIFSRLPEFLWAEVVATTCFTQNRSIIYTRHNKTPYELLRGRKPNVEYFHVFGSLCYLTNDRDDLGKMKPKVDIRVFIGYFSKRPRADTMNTPSKEDLENLFGPMFEEYFEKRSFDTLINSAAQPTQFHEDSSSTSSIIVEEHEAPPIETTSDEQTSPISLTNADEVNQEDSADFNGNLDFVPYNTSSHEEIESSTAALEPSNVQNFHQVQPSTHIWTKDHPLDQVIGDLSKPVMTRQRLQTDSEVCMYALTVSTIEPKNIKEAMADYSWIESMQDKMSQFERPQVWELVPRPEGKNIIALK